MRIEGIRIKGERVVDASIVTPNLAIWVDADNAASYPGTGTTVTDLSGNGRTQVLSNAAIYTVLAGVKCWDCSSGNDIQAAVTGPVLPTSGFTYIAWARMKPSSADFRTLFRSLPDDHALLIQVGTNNLGMYDNPTNSFYSAGATVGQYADVWTQWCVTGDSSGQTFYINGQQVGTTVQTAAGNSHQYFGGLGIGQSFGYVANMFLYTTKLTQEQIQQNYYNIRNRMYNVVSFTSTGTTTWTAPAGVTSVEYLVVGGGGGAGNGYDNAGGGGGGGGMVLTGTLSVTPGQSYTVTVGTGGTGGADTRTNNPGTAGNPSVFASVTALGGGQGLGSRTGGAAGAAQVGSTTAPTGGSGSGGGNGGKGGGGAGGAGSANSGATGGAGGAGTVSSITGSSVTYGVGGAGGGAGTPTTDGANGTANRGNGGQGGKSGSTDSARGGDGGSGIVVLRFIL